MSIFYTADLHFGHSNIIRYCNRPFSSVEEMDAALISRWSNVVKRDDHAYVVGDFSFCAKRSVVDHLELLVGRKYLVVGNHDASWMGRVDASLYVDTEDEQVSAIDNGQKVTLNHFPFMEPIPKAYLVYGHIHYSQDPRYWPLLCTYERCLNAGVDVNDYMPVTLDELIENNDRWRISSSCNSFELVNHDFQIF